MTRKPTRRDRSVNASDTRRMLRASICCNLLRSTTQSMVCRRRERAACAHPRSAPNRSWDASPERLRVHLADQVEVDETVVHRRDQRVGQVPPPSARNDRRDPACRRSGNRHPATVRTRAPRIPPRSGWCESHGPAWQLVPGALDRLGPVVEIAAHRPLAMIQIEARHTAPLAASAIAT